MWPARAGRRPTLEYLHCVDLGGGRAARVFEEAARRLLLLRHSLSHSAVYRECIVSLEDCRRSHARARALYLSLSLSLAPSMESGQARAPRSRVERIRRARERARPSKSRAEGLFSLFRRAGPLTLSLAPAQQQQLLVCSRALCVVCLLESIGRGGRAPLQ